MSTKLVFRHFIFLFFLLLYYYIVCRIYHPSVKINCLFFEVEQKMLLYHDLDYKKEINKYDKSRKKKKKKRQLQYHPKQSFSNIDISIW